jgi:hypothetical protein
MRNWRNMGWVKACLAYPPKTRIIAEARIKSDIPDSEFLARSRLKTGSMLC